MPSRNRIKVYVPDSYYHIYNRGVNKNKIFLEDSDYRVFLNLFKRHLSVAPSVDQKGREYTHLSSEIELLAYCLMPNHFHLLVYQHEINGMKKLLQHVMTAYVQYFNKKYKRVGPLFQDRYKASLIQNEAYLLHISRYIHLNPKKIRDVLSYEYSSILNFLDQKKSEWLKPERILDMHAEPYKVFLLDSDDYNETYSEVSQELAQVD